MSFLTWYGACNQVPFAFKLTCTCNEVQMIKSAQNRCSIFLIRLVSLITQPVSSIKHVCLCRVNDKKQETVGQQYLPRFVTPSLTHNLTVHTSLLQVTCSHPHISCLHTHILTFSHLHILKPHSHVNIITPSHIHTSHLPTSHLPTSHLTLYSVQYSTTSMKRPAERTALARNTTE